MRRSHSSSQSAAQPAAQARPKSQPPLKLGESIKFVGAKSASSSSSTQQALEEEQHWSKLIEKYDKSRGRFAANSRPMLETLVEHSSTSSADAIRFASGERTRPEDDDNSDEDEPELSPLTSSGSSLASSTLSLSSVSSASTVIGAKRTMAVTKEPTKVLTISDEEDHQSSESSSSSSGISSLSERKASLSLSTTSSTVSSGSISGSGESLGQLERAVGECLEDLVGSVVVREKQEECTLQALMVKRIPLYEHKVEPNQIISLARRHIFNALKHAQEVGERESGWWVRVGRDKNAANNLDAQSPIISWHQDIDRQREHKELRQVFQVPAREIIDCLIEHELVIWLLKSNQPAGGNYNKHDNWRALNDELLNQRTTTTTSGNLIGVHSEEVDWDDDQQQEQQQRHGSQMAAVIWLCSSELDARQVKECWQLKLNSSQRAAGASVSRSSPPPPPIVCQTPADCARPQNNEIKLNDDGESEGSGIVIAAPTTAAAAAADQRTHRRDNNERQMSATTERSSNLRRAASVFDLSTTTTATATTTTTTSGGRPGTGSQDETTAAATTTSGLASYYRNARSNTNKLIRNLKDEMVKLNSGGGGGGNSGRRVSSILVAQRQSECARTTLRAASSVCDLSDNQKLPRPSLVGDGKLVRSTSGIECAPPTSQACNVTPVVAPPVVKPRTSILKARRDTAAAAANADAQAKLAARQQVVAASSGKCDLPQQQQQQQERDINRSSSGSRMVSSTSLNRLHQLQGGDAGAGEKPPRSILKAIQAEKEPSNQLNESSKCSSSSGTKSSGAQVVVVSARAASSAAAPPPSPLKIKQEHPRRADSNEITRATSIGGGGAGDERGKRDKKAELLVTPRSSRGGADGTRRGASPQPGARSQTLALGSTSWSSSSAVSKRKLVHSLANCEIVARTHQQTQRARELSLSTSDIREQRQQQQRDSGATKSKEIGVEKSCTVARRDGDSGGTGTSKREEPAKTRGSGGGEDDFVSSGSLAREQAFERLRMRASCYDITRLMSKNNTIQSQLARLRAGGSGDLRQRKPAELRASSDQLAGNKQQELKPKPKRDGVSATANQTKTTTKTPDDPKRSKRMSMFEQSSATRGARDTSRSASIKRAESVKCKKPPVGGVAVLRHQEPADEVEEAEDISESLEVDKQKVVAAANEDEPCRDQEDDDDEESDIEEEEEARAKDEVDQGEDSEATIVEEGEEATKTSKTSALGKATAGGLSKFNLLRQSFNQKTISSMLKFSSRASLRIGAGKRAPVPGPEVPPAAPASGHSDKSDSAIVVAAEPKRVTYQAPTKLPKASKSTSSKQLVDLQQQQQIAAIDSATMMLYNRHMQQRQQQQHQQQQQLLQQQQQYAYQWHHQQQQIYIQQQHHHQRQQLAYMTNQYMTTAAHHQQHRHHLYQPHLLAPGAPIVPQAAMGGFAAAATSATTSMYAMSAQQPLMMPPQAVQPHHPQPVASGVGSILKKSILKSSSSSNKHNNIVATQMSYSAAGGRAPPASQHHHHQPSQQLIPLSVNHHSSVNIVYGTPRMDNPTGGQQQFVDQEEPPAAKIKQPSRANLLGASMRKTVKSILVSSKTLPSSSRQPEGVAETEKQVVPPARPLKSALKKPKSRVCVPDSIQLNSEGSDGDQSTSSTLESTSSNSSFDHDRDQQVSSDYHQPKSVLKKNSSSGGTTKATVLDESPELSSTDESSTSSTTSSSDNNFKRATSTRCSRRITKSPPKQFESGAAVATRASIRAPRKNVTFSTKLTSIL